MKIIIVGAGLTGLTYALLLKREGYKVEVYEKRHEEEHKKINSIIYITKGTLDTIKPFIENDIFNKDNPKSFEEGIYRKLMVPDVHANIHISELLQALLNAAEREGIPVYRQSELVSFSRNQHDMTNATFLDSHGKSITVECDQLLLACGNHDVKDVLRNNQFKEPVKLHYTNLVGARIPLDDNFKFINPENAKQKKLSIATYLDCNNAKLMIAQLAAYYFNYTTSVGNFTTYLATQRLFALVSTYPPEQREELSSRENKAIFLRDRLKNLRTGCTNKNIPEVDFTWLAEMESKITKDNVCDITTYATVHVPDKSLLQQGVIVIGDAFVTAPFIYGSEYNEHVSGAFQDGSYQNGAYQKISNYLKQIKQSSSDERNKMMDDFIETLWAFILNKKGIGKYLGLSDLVGNSILPNGTRVNMSYYIGYPISRELLERLSQDPVNQHSLIPIPKHQQGGRLEQVDQNSQTLLLSTNQLQSKKANTQSSFVKLGLFAVAATVVVGVAAASYLNKPKL